MRSVCSIDPHSAQDQLVGRRHARHVDLCLAALGNATGVPLNVTEHSEVVDCVQQAAHLVDAPFNELHTEAARVEMPIISGKELHQRGYGAIYAVGRAAEHPPALVFANYKPTSSPATTMAWLGPTVGPVPVYRKI
ncbi:putative aminopeptidase npepl1, partial [Cladochytrium tenue]